MNHESLSFLWMPGRVLFVSYFLALGLSHLIHFRGVLVLFDWQTRIGALILFCIIFPAPFLLHRFWKETDSYMRLSEFAHMMKDFALAGAALIVAMAT
jgi:uncharacterized membrane protein YphA (DoxX/SURF4 family)